MTAYNQYFDGQPITFSALFTREDGTPQDPSAVAFRFKDPISGDITEFVDTDPDMSHPDTGSFSITVDSTDFNEGTWYYKWIGTGYLEAAYEFAFIIKHENVA